MIDKLFEKTKIEAFLYKDSALLGTLLTKLNFTWDSDIPTAGISGREIAWNPEWFLSLSEDSRVAVLLHELWHLARLHNIRRGTRDKVLWNIACDIRINNDLSMDGYSLEEAGGLVDFEYDEPRLTEEEIYDKIYERTFDGTVIKMACDICYSSDPEEEQIEIQNVQTANEYAKSIGRTSNCEIEEILHTFLKPKVPWRRLLKQYFLDLVNEDYSWKKPNRRYEDIYLPSLTNGEKLSSLNYYVDTSGSISRETLLRFNTELRTIWRDIKPSLLRVINFDTQIRDIQELKEGMMYNIFKFEGRGGTRLEPVIEHIKETKPIAAIIFSDLYCNIPNITIKTPIIWIIIGNPSVKIPYGKTIHLPEEF